MFLARITGLLIASSMAMPGCSLVFEEGQQPPCEGLSLLKDDFSGGPNAQLWWEWTLEGSQSALVDLDPGLLLETGADTTERGAILGTLGSYSATGNFVVEVRETDLEGSFYAALFMNIYPVNDEPEAVVSISGGKLSLFLEGDDSSGGSMPFSTDGPFWISFSLDGENAHVLTSRDGKSFTRQHSMPFAAMEVEVSVGLTVGDTADTSSHYAELGSIGSPQSWSCSE